MLFSFAPASLEPFNNPYTGGLSRVRVVSNENGESYAVIMGAFEDNPRLFDNFDKRYSLVIGVLKFLGLVIMGVSIVLSFMWQWWSFIVGGFLFAGTGNLISRYVRKFVVEIVETRTDGINRLSKMEVLWTL